MVNDQSCFNFSDEIIILKIKTNWHLHTFFYCSFDNGCCWCQVWFDFFSVQNIIVEQCWHHMPGSIRKNFNDNRNRFCFEKHTHHEKAWQSGCKTGPGMERWWVQISVPAVSHSRVINSFLLFFTDFESPENGWWSTPNLHTPTATMSGTVTLSGTATLSGRVTQISLGKILQTSRYTNYMTLHTTWHRQSIQHQDIWQMLCMDQRGTAKLGDTTVYPVGEVVLAFIK